MRQPSSLAQTWEASLSLLYVTKLVQFNKVDMKGWIPSYWEITKMNGKESLQTTFFMKCKNFKNPQILLSQMLPFNEWSNKFAHNSLRAIWDGQHWRWKPFKWVPKITWLTCSKMDVYAHNMRRELLYLFKTYTWLREFGA